MENEEGFPYFDLYYFREKKVQCKECENTTRAEDGGNRVLDLPVEAQDNWDVNLALNRFATEEEMDGENMYHCLKCGKLTRANKKITFLSLPKVLFIAKKLYSFDHQKAACEKRTQPIRYPLTFSHAKKSSCDKVHSKYELYGITAHTGTIASGHHFAFCKKNEQWWKFDDENVTPADINEVRRAQPQFLCYRKSG